MLSVPVDTLTLTAAFCAAPPPELVSDAVAEKPTGPVALAVMATDAAELAEDALPACVSVSILARVR